MTQQIPDLMNMAYEPDTTSGSGSFEPLPKGTYTVTFSEIGDWEPKVFPKLLVTQFDEKRQAIKGPDKKTVKVEQSNVTIYTTDVKLTVLEGPYAGRILFYRLSTHPNTPWVIGRFVNGLGQGAVPPGRFSEMVGTVMEVDVTIESYPNEDIIDKKTGETIFANTKTRNQCVAFRPADIF